MTTGIKIIVTCYSGSTAHERPVTFTLGDKLVTVAEVIDRWYGPDYLYFRIRAENGDLYILRCDEMRDEWELEFFRKSDEE